LNPSLTATVIFVLAYAALVVFKTRKSQILWLGIAAGIITGLIGGRDILSDINWNVMGIFAGTLVLAEFFILSRVPDAIAAFLVRRSTNVGAAFLYVCLFSSILSIFIENIATVLIVAPIALTLAKKIKTSPVPIIIAIAITSNLQGTATLIGDPPSMILANYMKMNFNDFFIYHGKPGIFFAVELAAVASMVVLYFLFRSYRQPVSYSKKEEVRSFAPTWLLILMVVGLAFATVIDPDFHWFGGFICMFMAVVGVMVWGKIDIGETKKALKGYDWGTTAFLAGVFVMVGMLERAGVIEGFAGILGNRLGDNTLMTFMVVVWASVLFSAFIDNVPYITAMIPVVQVLSQNLGISMELLVFGLLVGSCLGGNITPVGASANIVATGILKKSGHVISFGQFVRIGLPFTLVATAVGAAFIYFVWN
jgi:Na+/H+ antiporter NhaD/arsenite permease-like protein